ncbi:MAG: hypothetical protein ACE5K4_03020 [Candidatus Hydrothermarchaeota archaeon]
MDIEDVYGNIILVVVVIMLIAVAVNVVKIELQREKIRSEYDRIVEIKSDFLKAYSDSGYNSSRSIILESCKLEDKSRVKGKSIILEYYLDGKRITQRWGENKEGIKLSWLVCIHTGDSRFLPGRLTVIL